MIELTMILIKNEKIDSKMKSKMIVSIILQFYSARWRRMNCLCLFRRELNLFFTMC